MGHSNMALSQLNAEEHEVVLRCLCAAVEGPFFEDEEFHALFGLYRHEVAAVVARWPEVCDTDENAALAVNNSLVNLLWYPHYQGRKLQEIVGATDAEIERILVKFRQGRPETLMLGTPHITKTTAQLTAVIHITIPWEKIQNVMGPGLGELMAAIAAQGIAPAGPWFTYHVRIDPDISDFDIGVPVAVPVAAAGRMKPGQLPATTVARTVYQGPYDGLADAWAEFDTWIRSQGHTPASDLWERYVLGPESSPDTATWRTELNRPLLGDI
jgi:effector-binding domain-containing protein